MIIPGHLLFSFKVFICLIIVFFIFLILCLPNCEIFSLELRKIFLFIVFGCYLLLFFLYINDEQCKGCNKALQWHLSIQVQSLPLDQYFIHETYTKSTNLQSKNKSNSSFDLFFRLYYSKTKIYAGRRMFNMYQVKFREFIILFLQWKLYFFWSNSHGKCQLCSLSMQRL